MINAQKQFLLNVATTFMLFDFMIDVQNQFLLNVSTNFIVLDSLLDAKDRNLLNVSIIFIRTPPLRLEILGFRAGKRVGLGSRHRSEPASGFGVWVR